MIYHTVGLFWHIGHYHRVPRVHIWNPGLKRKIIYKLNHKLEKNQMGKYLQQYKGLKNCFTRKIITPFLTAANIAKLAQNYQMFLRNPYDVNNISPHLLQAERILSAFVPIRNFLGCKILKIILVVQVNGKILRTSQHKYILTHIRYDASIYSQCASCIQSSKHKRTKHESSSKSDHKCWTTTIKWRLYSMLQEEISGESFYDL